MELQRTHFLSKFGWLETAKIELCITYLLHIFLMILHSLHRYSEEKKIMIKSGIFVLHAWDTCISQCIKPTCLLRLLNQKSKIIKKGQ